MSEQKIIIILHAKLSLIRVALLRFLLMKFLPDLPAPYTISDDESTPSDFLSK